MWVSSEEGRGGREEGHSVRGGGGAGLSGGQGTPHEDLPTTTAHTER